MPFDHPVEQDDVGRAPRSPGAGLPRHRRCGGRRKSVALEMPDESSASARSSSTSSSCLRVMSSIRRRFLARLGHVLAGRGIIDHLGDVGRMVADPLEVLGDEQQMRRLADVVRIFHHVRQQGAKDGIVEIVDRLVALADPDCGLRHRVRRRRRAHRGPCRSRSAPFPEAATTARSRSRRLEQRDPLGDILGIVADPLDDAGDLERRDSVTKVARHRRAKRDQLHRALLGLDLEPSISCRARRRVARLRCPARSGSASPRGWRVRASPPISLMSPRSRSISSSNALMRMAGLLLHVLCSDQP